MFATFLPFWGAPTSTNKSHDARSPSRRGRPARHDRRSGMFPELLNRLLCSAEVYDPHVEAAPVISSLHLHSDFFTSDDDDERTSTTKFENFSSSPTTTPTLATTSEEEEGHVDVVATPNISPFTVTDTRVMVQPITTHNNTDVARLRRPRINERRPRRRNMRASLRPDSPPITLLAKVVDESAHADDANDVPPMPSFSSCTSATEEQEDEDHPSDLSRHAWMSRRRCLAPTSAPSPPPPLMNDEYDGHLALRTASLYPLASHAYVDRIIFCQHTQQCFALLTRLTAAHDHAWSLHLRLYQLYYYYVAPLLHGRSMSELPPDVQQSAILQPPLSRMEQRQMEHQLLHTGTGAVKRFHASFIPAVPTASSKSSACEGDDDDDDDEQRSSVVLDYQVFTYRFDATWSALLRSVKAFIAEPQIPTPSTSQSSTDDGTTATEVEERWPPMQQQSSVSFAATMLHSMELFERDCEVQVAIQEIERWVCWCREIFFATRMHDAKAVATQSAASRHVDETEPTSFGAIATTATTTSHHSPINWTYAQQERISERIALERQHARWLVIQRAREDGSWKKKPPTPTPTPTPPAEQQPIVDDGGGGRGEREVPSAPRAMRGANHRHVFHADDDAMEMHHRPINTSCFGFGGFFS